jgi:hypothetical protein
MDLLKLGTIMSLWYIVQASFRAYSINIVKRGAFLSCLYSFHETSRDLNSRFFHDREARKSIMIHVLLVDQARLHRKYQSSN